MRIAASSCSRFVHPYASASVHTRIHTYMRRCQIYIPLADAHFTSARLLQRRHGARLRGDECKATQGLRAGPCPHLTRDARLVRVRVRVRVKGWGQGQGQG